MLSQLMSLPPHWLPFHRVDRLRASLIVTQRRPKRRFSVLSPALSARIPSTLGSGRRAMTKTGRDCRAVMGAHPENLRKQSHRPFVQVFGQTGVAGYSPKASAFKLEAVQVA